MAKVLLVEDAPDTRDLVRMMLEMAGHEIDEAVTGEEAVTKAKTVRPDVILMDMSLPGELDGLDAVRILRAEADFERIPILAVTAHAMNEDRKRVFEAGCDEHITKPIFDLENFIQTVSRFAERGRENGAAQIHTSIG